MITVTVTNNGPTGGANVNSFSQQFTVTVTPVNQAPTIDNIPNQTAILENDTIPQEVDLTGIGPGLGDTGQLLNVFATSSNTGLIFNPAVTYPTSSTGGVSTGELFYTAAPNMSGTATITVVVTDNGGVANGGVNQTTTTFTVTVDPIDVPPTLTFIPNPNPIGVNAGQQTINLTGITPGQGEAGQTVTITATSSNPSLIPNPTVSYTNPKATGTLTYTPVPNSTGTAVITVTVIEQRQYHLRRQQRVPAVVHRGGRPGTRRSRHHDHAGQRHLHPGRGAKSRSTRASPSPPATAPPSPR